jgi:hypothetical protein
VDGRKIDVGSFVVACCDSPEVLESAEHAFDEIAQLVGLRIVGMRMLAGRVWRDDSFDPAFSEPVAKASCVVGAIGQQATRQPGGGQEFSGASEIVAVTGCDQE